MGSDGGDRYEPYGHITINIGSQDVNQAVEMWKVDSSSHIKVPNGQPYFTNYTYTFMEFESFSHVGNITAHGEVKEYDGFNTDDLIVKLDGDLFQTKDILNGNVTRKYLGQSESYYIKITLKLTKILEGMV